MTAMIKSEGEVLCPASILLLSSLVTEPPNKERVQAMGLGFRGDEEEEFFKLLRIPCGRFVPPFLAAHQKELASQEFISKLLSLYMDAGLEFKKNTGERPDQIGVILEFLALLKSDGREPPDDLVRLITCPLRRFAEALGKATDHPLFRKVAVALAEMVESETVKIS